jgi:hypothetical protein
MSALARRSLAVDAGTLLVHDFSAAEKIGELPYKLRIKLCELVSENVAIFAYSFVFRDPSNVIFSSGYLVVTVL